MGVHPHNTKDDTPKCLSPSSKSVRQNHRARFISFRPIVTCRAAITYEKKSSPLMRDLEKIHQLAHYYQRTKISNLDHDSS